MNFILLGKTKQRVSSISLGTWSYGGANLSGKMSVGWANQEDEDSQQALQTAYRSEEHTSELQSRTNLVCRLLLEKKNKIKKTQKHKNKKKKKNIIFT